MTADLLTLSDWLLTEGVIHAAMESTGEYWKLVYNILEENFELLLVNPHHIKAVPGRTHRPTLAGGQGHGQTDVNDAEWIAELLQYGLLRASFVPPKGQRALRELTRARTTFVRERATLVNRVQKVLESANLKLGDVARDVLGVSGRAMLEAVIEGHARPEQMVSLARGRLRNKHDQLVKADELACRCATKAMYPAPANTQSITLFAHAAFEVIFPWRAVISRQIDEAT